MNDDSARARRSTLFVVLAAVIAAACTTAPSSALGTPGPSPSATAAAAPTAAATIAPTAIASPTPSPGLNIAWSTSGATFEPHVPASGLARTSDGRYLMLGQNLQIGAGSSMAASSTDGVTWMLEPDLSPVAGVTLLAAASISVLGPIPGPTIIVGSRAMNGTVTGVVYLKRPGGWAKVADQPSLAGANLRGVIVTNGISNAAPGRPDRFVAFGGYQSGTSGPSCASGDCISGVGIWTSSDGATWTSALRIPATSSSGEMLGGVVSGPSGLVAYARKGVGPEATLIWTSPDGRVWTAAHPTGLDGIGIHGMVGQGGTAFFGSGGTAGYLAVGTVNAPGHTVFRSADGIDWSPIASGPSLEGVISVDDGFVGWNNSAFTTSAFVRDSFGVWTSLDGTTWKHTDAYEEFYSGGMVADGQTVLSIGSPNDPNPVWIGTITVVPSE